MTIKEAVAIAFSSTGEKDLHVNQIAQRKTPEGKKEYILHSINPSYLDIHPMDGGKISAVYVRTLSIEA